MTSLKLNCEVLILSELKLRYKKMTETTTASVEEHHKDKASKDSTCDETEASKQEVKELKKTISAA